MCLTIGGSKLITITTKEADAVGRQVLNQEKQDGILLHVFPNKPSFGYDRLSNVNKKELRTIYDEVHFIRMYITALSEFGASACLAILGRGLTLNRNITIVGGTNLLAQYTMSILSEISGCQREDVPTISAPLGFDRMFYQAAYNVDFWTHFMLNEL